MSRNIIFNKTNVVNKNTFRYTLPNMVEFVDGDVLTMAQSKVPFSWFNITKAYNNNFFQYKWWNMNGDLENYDVTINDGYYSIETLNKFIELKMVEREHYLRVSESGSFQYFINIKINSTYYATGIRLHSLGPTMNFGSGFVNYDTYYDAPVNWRLPASGFETPSIIIPSNNTFGDLIGFSSGTISGDTSNAISNGEYAFVSNKSPNMMPSSSAIVTCNLVDNIYSDPNDVLYSFFPTVNYGSDIVQNANLVWSKIKPGKYKYVELKMYDQEFRPLQLRDDAVTIILAIDENNRDK
jgi:hypothetical protein